jgi:hypothetical protein
MMTNFGYAPGVLDYWMLLSDWRNGSFAIMLALGVLLIGHALAIRNKMLAAEGLKPVEGIDENARSGVTPGEERPPAPPGADKA